MSPVNFFYEDDLVNDSFSVDSQGFVRVPTTPGLGYEINEKKIGKYTTSKVTLSS
jgi:L-alanine-DL-glutamate epimerase-like enolase superfamily enzyme